VRKKNILCTRNVDFQLDTTADSGDGRTLDGYAAVFDQPTQIRSWEGNFEETIARGAFDKTLRERKPVMQYNHGRDARIGTVPIGTFDTIEADSHGLHTVGRLFDHPDVERVRQALDSGDINGMSFTFEVTRDEWTDKNGVRITSDRELSRLLFDAGDRGPLKRTLKEVKLREAGPVLYPAYEGTSVGVRGEEEVELTREEVIESYSRTANLEDDADQDEAVRAWLDAETNYRTEQWLEAENLYRWLEAEKAHNASVTDAATRTSGTENNDRAADKGTRSDSNTSTKKNNKRIRMFTLNELRERVAAIEVRMEDLNTEYRDAELPEKEQAEFDELESELKRSKDSIAKIERRLGIFKDDAKDSKKIDGAPAVHVGNEIRHDLDELRNASSSTEQYYGKVRDNALRVIEQGRAAVDKKDIEASQERMESLLRLPGRDDAGHTLAERYTVTSNDLYERAFFKACAAGGNIQVLNADEFRAMQMGSDPAGGYAIPVQLDPTIIWTMPGILNPLRRLAKHVQIVGKEYQGVLSNGTTVQRNAEGAETSDNSFTLSNYTVRTKRADGYVPFTYEAEIGWDGLRSTISYALAQAKDAEEAHNFMLGDGTGNTPNGLLGTINNTTTKVLTADAGLLAYSDWYNLEAQLDERYRANASIIAHKAIYQQVRQYDTAGGAQLWERIGNGQPSQLLGYPALEIAGSYNGTPNFDSTIATGKKVAVFGDFSNFLIVDRIGMNTELIPQVFGPNNRPTGQRAIFAVWMNNTKVLVDNAFRVLTVQ